MMKVGIIRCMQTEDFCPGTTDFKAWFGRRWAHLRRFRKKLKSLVLSTAADVPGKKAVLRAKELVKRGADTIAFASCIQKGTPIGYACPFAKRMKMIVQAAVGEEIRILDYTH